MGWYFCDSWKSARAVRDGLNRERAEHLEVLAQAATAAGRHLWTAYRHPGTEVRWVQLDLIEGPGAAGGGWGYKPIDETMGPAEVDCPLAVLEAAGPIADTPAAGYAAAWRDRVRSYHGRRSRKLSMGERFKLYGGAFEVAALPAAGRRSYTIRRLADGALFRLGPGQLAAVELEERP